MSARDQFVLVGVSHRTASVDQRERLALDPQRIDAFYDGILAIDGVRESFALSTCNRLEIYARIDQVEAVRKIGAFVCAFNRIDPEAFETMQMNSSDLEAAVHLFEVAAGIDSQIIGETEILGQIKNAYAVAARRGAAGPVLNRLVQKSFQAAKWVRTHTAIGEGKINVATVAVDLAIKIFGRLDQTRILVIGTGDIGEKTVKALQSRGAGDLTVTSRRLENAESLARRVGGRAAPVDILADGVPGFDIVISSTSAPTAILTRDRVDHSMSRRAHRPLFLIDLAVPRDIEATCGQLNNVYLYNVDDLAEIAEENLAQRRAEVGRCRPILAERAERAWESLAPRIRLGAVSANGVSLNPGG